MSFCRSRRLPIEGEDNKYPSQRSMTIEYPFIKHIPCVEFVMSEQADLIGAPRPSSIGASDKTYMSESELPSERGDDRRRGH